jgi:hypothetical protein
MIAAAISSVLADPTPWVAKGHARVTAATWDVTVEATVAAYREVAR